jgi:hypothetical protein
MAPAVQTQVGRNFFSRFVTKPQALPSSGDGSAAREGSAGATPTLAGGDEVGVARNPWSPITAQAIGPMPDDDEEDTGDETERAAAGVVDDLAADTLWSVSLAVEAGGGVDGARWGDTAELSLVKAWSGSSPPETPSRLLVTHAAARRFERAVGEHQSAIGVTVRGSAETAASGKDRATRSPVRDRSLIALPEGFWDGFCDDAGLHDHKSRAIHLNWLRVQEAYAAAESEAVDLSIEAVGRRVQQGRGGGTALQRMQERKRRLRRKLDELDLDKRAVKRELSQ